MARNDDIDWSELLVIGSLIGNLVQADRNIAAKDEIQKKESQLNQLLNDRQALLTNLRRFQHGVEVLEQKVHELERINSELLKTNASLEAEKTNLIAEYETKLEKLQGGKS